MERYTVTASTSFTSTLSQRPTFQTKEIPPYTTFQTRPIITSYLRPEDPEIRIFDADKYFNDDPDQKQLKPPQPLDQIAAFPRLSSVSSVDGYRRNCRSVSFHATPTASSEASWNSQSGLLSNPPGSIPISMKNLPLNGQRRGSSTTTTSKWLFGRRCPCSGKKSVQVEEKFREPRNPTHAISTPNPSTSLTLKKQSFKTEEAISSAKEAAEKGAEEVYQVEEITKLKLVSSNFSPDEVGRLVAHSGGFTFPILNPAPAGKLLQQEEPPRLSLEVFRPSDDAGLPRSMEFQRRGMMSSFPGENCRRSLTFPTSPKGREDDVASDSSSDLFEIESFSTQAASYPMYRRRDSLDEASSFEGRRYGAASHGLLPFRRSLDETTSMTPTECYEPSEVSVDWSVTTAEGFDRSSVANFSTAASELEEQRSGEDAPPPAVAGGGAGIRKGKGNGLLSCRCEKAVSVGPHPVKCVPEPQRLVQGSFPLESSARITAMSRLARVSTASVARVAVAENSPIARSHSARFARPIATR